MKIGLLGGSFNPIHIGHLILAEEARDHFSLRKVLFIPSYRSPHKKNEARRVTPRHRVAMVRLAVKGHAGFAVSDIEIRRGGVSYTIDTVRELRRKIPRAEFFFLVGSDWVKQLSTWKEARKLFPLCRFVMVERPEFPVKKVPHGFERLTIPQIGISSKAIRQRVREGRSISYQVPEAVEKYILKHALYR